MADRFVTVPDSLELPADVLVPIARLSDAGTAGRAVLDAETAADGRTALGVDAIYAKRNAGPRWSADKMGVAYDGTDQTAPMQALLNTVAAAGGGVIEVDGLIRCDGQLTIPTVLSGVQLRQAPIRITGTIQTMPGSTFAETTPYSNGAGFDLRYAGRTDAGCSTVKGSAIVLNPAALASDRGLIAAGPGLPDQAWILSVDPGVSWSLYRPARATATVSLTSFGGRIQSCGYGTLEIDHLQIVTGSATSAPMVASTATTILAHDNLMVGAVGKTGATCDEDPFILGGPGQGTHLTAPLTAGTPYTTLTVAPLPVGVTSGRRMLIGAGTTGEQEVTLSASAVTGATSLTVTSFTPAADHPASQPVYIGYAQSQINTTSWTVPSCPFQGYGTEITRNHFHRTRRISIGGFASSLSIRRNAWMHNTGSNLAATPSTLTSGLTAGTTYTTLPVSALSRDVIAGDIIQTGAGATSQEWTATADATAGATSISVTSAAAAYAFAVGTKTFNTTHIGAAIESRAIGPEINAPLIVENRIGVIGYSYAVRCSGATTHGYIAANDCQDAQSAPLMIAGYRFDRRWLWGALYNLVIPGIIGPPTIPAIDDWSYVDGRQSQTILHHEGPAVFSQGVAAQGVASTYLPNSPVAAYTYTPKVIGPAGSSWRTRMDATAITYEHHGSDGADYVPFKLENTPLGVNGVFNSYATNRFKVTAVNAHLSLIAKTGYKVYLGDAATPEAAWVAAGNIVAKAILTTPVATGSRPVAATAGAGTMIYDSTLSKPIWSDGTVWRDAMGTAV